MDNIFFLSCFLPLTLALYWLIPGLKGKNVVLLLASLLFYSFGSLTGLALLVGMTLLNYLLSLLFKYGKLKIAAQVTGIVLNLGFLGFFKYADFLLSGILGLAPLQTGIAVPLGISFFTFKCISPPHFGIFCYSSPSSPISPWVPSPGFLSLDRS